ncbi:MAG: hypothetical protein LBK44_06995 [Spirochaetales bacterium]|nr:hypothetical protein [Spirochaetales bacterium]
MQILWAFRCNAPEDGRFPIGMDCSGRLRAPGIPCAPRVFKTVNRLLHITLSMISIVSVPTLSD